MEWWKKKMKKGIHKGMVEEKRKNGESTMEWWKKKMKKGKSEWREFTRGEIRSVTLRRNLSATAG